VIPRQGRSRPAQISQASRDEDGGRVGLGQLRVPSSPQGLGVCSMPETRWTRQGSRIPHVRGIEAGSGERVSRAKRDRNGWQTYWHTAIE
jgi:hypothetical protein